jgi:hypothetical protein
MRATKLAKRGQKCQCNNDNNAITTTPKTPGQRWICMAMPAQQWQRRQCNKGNDASVAPSETLAQQGQQCQHNAGKDASLTLAAAWVKQGQQHC